MLFNDIITTRMRVQAEQPTFKPATNRKCTPISIIYVRKPYHQS